ncbi:MAG: Paraquat-inducible protein B [Syntrophorhabdus sp. PtaU1.Bin002]|nr:MAG: Paraquat-inducible protein B [Syntrophorhabdus sp. PtaB.Bin006]OPY71226.1 MAG: Paraquat-inducible protein B [Syntrophorhabdus sp. PtaU1.Bin002]
MSKPVNKKVIGIFVVVAIALVVAAILILGSGKFFKTYPKYVMFFEGSVKGLAIGAPVDFRGVKIGTVTEIKMMYNPKDLSIIIPVYIELGQGEVEVAGVRPRDLVKMHREQGQELIKRGIKAQLEMQSFVTGQLMISLDFYPDKPARFVGADKRYPEIPTVPTTLQELTKRVEKIPIEQIFDKLGGALDGINKTINSAEMARIMRSMAQGVDDARALLQNINTEIKPVAADFKDTTQEIRKLAVSATKASDYAGLTLKSAQGAMGNIENMTGDNSLLVYRLNKTLGELENTARSLRILTETLDQQPQSLFFGKKKIGRE